MMCARKGVVCRRGKGREMTARSKRAHVRRQWAAPAAVATPSTNVPATLPSRWSSVFAALPLLVTAALLVFFALDPRGTPAATALSSVSVFDTKPSGALSAASPTDGVDLPPPGPDETVRFFDQQTGDWKQGPTRDVPKGSELIHAGRLLRVSRTLGALTWAREIDISKLGDADTTYDPAAPRREPEAGDVVRVLGADGHHTTLGRVEPGQRMAFQGRVYETRAGPGDKLEARDSGLRVNQVTRTYERHSPTLVDLTVRYGDGREGVLTGTPEHSFFVPARGGYVPMGELVLGVALQTPDGATATVAARSDRHGDFEVYNLEVEHTHNYFVSPPGSDSPGVQVHNATYGPGRPMISTRLADRVTNELPPGQGRTPSEVKQARNFFERNRDAAQEWWSQRTREPWPGSATHAEHPRPLKDGGDPLYIEPGFGGPNRPHMGKRTDGLSDFQRWGKQGGRPKNQP
jgi:Pretoxin HINT domain